MDAIHSQHRSAAMLAQCAIFVGLLGIFAFAGFLIRSVLSSPDPASFINAGIYAAFAAFVFGVGMIIIGSGTLIGMIMLSTADLTTEKRVRYMLWLKCGMAAHLAITLLTSAILVVIALIA